MPEIGFGATLFSKKLFISFCILLVSISFILSLALGSYWDKSITELLSSRVEDGWCNPQIQGFGAHCFGDYQLPLSNIQSGNYWQGNAYPPIALTPFFLSSWLLTFLAPQVVLSFYLFVLFASLAVPAIYVAIKGTLGDLSWVGLLVLCAAAHPVIMTLDRGNNVGLVVPALMVLAFSVNGSTFAPSFAVAFAAAWRPQYVLLAFVFIGLRQFRRLVMTGLLTFAAYFFGFVFIPGGLSQNFRSWFHSVSLHGELGFLVDDGVANVSFARALVQVSRWISKLNADVGELGITYVEVSYGTWFAPGILLVLTSFIILIRCRTAVNPTVVTVVSLALTAVVIPITFGYYNLFAIVIGAIILCSKEEERKFKQIELSVPLPNQSNSADYEHWWRNAVVIAVCLTLAPIPIPTTVAAQTLIIEYSGLIWTIIIFLGLATIVLSEVESRKVTSPPS